MKDNRLASLKNRRFVVRLDGDYLLEDAKKLVEHLKKSGFSAYLAEI